MVDRTDNFNRADGGLGANWTVMSDVSNTGTLNIVSNQVKVNTNGTDAASRWSADAFSGDHYAQCVATTIGTNSGHGPTVRNQLATTAKYEADSNSSSSNLYYFDGINWSVLTSNIVGIANGDTLRLEVVGTGLTYRRNGTSILTVTDTTLSGGAPGLHLFEASGETIVADDWLGGPVGFSRVQGGAGYPAGAGSSVGVTISAVGSGNAICGFASWGDTTTNCTSVTDNQGNTYNLETTIADGTGGRVIAFSRTNITNAPTVITANFDASTSFRAILVDEFSGVSTASSDERDGSAHGGQAQASPGTGTDAVTSGTFTTTVNGDLLWAACEAGNTNVVASNGTSFLTGTQHTTDYSKQTEYRAQTTAGSGTAATFTQPSNFERVTFLIALKPFGAAAAAQVPYQPHAQLGPILAQ